MHFSLIYASPTEHYHITRSFGQWLPSVIKIGSSQIQWMTERLKASLVKCDIVGAAFKLQSAYAGENSNHI